MLRSRSRIRSQKKSRTLSHWQACPVREGTEVCTAKEITMRRFQAPLNVERLEDRQLLTVYSPSQIRHAYGFDQVALDGSGQTIAIVDAYDHPNIVDDLKIFDQEFGLPDPPQFTKVNQSGGTTLYLDELGNYQSEAGWSGSGGGISRYESEPVYQSSVQSTGKRTIPDVSYNASPDTRFWVYNSVSTGWDEVYGTSAGAPQWA